MLVLERYARQSIKIGDDIIVKVLSHRAHGVKIGIDAPKHIKILREELVEDILELESN